MRGVSKWKAGSGTFQLGAVRRLEQLLRPGRSRQRAPGERAGAEREDPVLLERRPDLAHQVEPPVEEVAAEDVEPAHPAVGLDHVDLERGGAVAVDGVALLAQGALQPEGLADHVERVRVPADVAEVDVVVVPDEVLLADGAEQGAVRRERLHPGVVERREHLLGRVEQRLDVLVVAGVEHGGDPVGLVDAERPSVGVDDGDPVVLVAEAHLLVVRHGAGDVLDHREPGGALQEALEHRRPSASSTPPSARVSRTVQNDQIRRPSKSTSTTGPRRDARCTPTSSTRSTVVCGVWSGNRLSSRRTRWPG